MNDSLFDIPEHAGSGVPGGGSLGANTHASAPLAVRMRPRTLDELVGQAQLRAAGSPLRQLIESVNQTFKGQLDLERHGGRTGVGVAVRVLQRILALTAAIWHNDKTGQPTLRSLVAYDH